MAIRRHLSAARLVDWRFVKSQSSEGETGVSEGYRALTGGCAVVGPRDVWETSWLEISGEDRARFLHGLVTCDIKALEAGGGTYGFFVDAKGKILADLVASALEGRLLLELPAGKAPEIEAHLARFVVADRVEMGEVTGPRCLVAGPSAGEILSSLFPGAGLPERWGHRVVEFDGAAFLLRGELRAGVTAWIVRAEATEALEKFVAAARRAGAAAATNEDLETVRIERGMPRAEVDFGSDHFPQETGLEDMAVSYTKGCYLGQEVIARIHYRGKVNHVLRGLTAVDGVSLASGRRLLGEQGEEAGRVTSAAFSPGIGYGGYGGNGGRGGRWIGLSILHRRFAEPGTQLALEPKGFVEVTELPFVASSGSVSRISNE